MDSQDYATEIVKTLAKAGYTAYFAGGWVRDFIMKHPSEDIDIATDAPPEVIMALFPKTILVGLAFGVVIVVMGGHQFEVASFRKDIEYIGGRKPSKIELSTPQEDALRRDFTINGMFYDPINDKVIDYVNGIADIHAGIIRAIGNPHERVSEDRLRMIRAVRFASRFDFDIDVDTKMAIKAHAKTLFPAVAMERIWQELIKMSKAKRFDQAIVELHRLGLLSVIFPQLEGVSQQVLENRVSNFQRFPKNTPTILYLMELFPSMPEDELLEICQYLKISNQEGKIAEFAHKGKLLMMREEEAPHEISNSQWAYFYADRFFHVCFDAITSQYPEEKIHPLLERHQQRRERLLPHIHRLAEKKPLVTAAILLDYGIQPGKEMGLLLKEAENIAIAYDLHDSELIIEKLKESPLWPKK